MLVGDDVWCQGFSEPDAGSDLASLSTRAVQGADGQWRITGQKIWTSNAHWAKWCYVLARTSDDRHRGLTFFLVPMDQAGIDEPVVHEHQAEPSLEASWQPGSAADQYEPAPEQGAEPGMEIG